METETFRNVLNFLFYFKRINLFKNFVNFYECGKSLGVVFTKPPKDYVRTISSWPIRSAPRLYITNGYQHMVTIRTDHNQKRTKQHRSQVTNNLFIIIILVTNLKPSDLYIGKMDPPRVILSQSTLNYNLPLSSYLMCLFIFFLDR